MTSRTPTESHKFRSTAKYSFPISFNSPRNRQSNKYKTARTSTIRRTVLSHRKRYYFIFSPISYSRVRSIISTARRVRVIGMCTRFRLDSVRPSVSTLTPFVAAAGECLITQAGGRIIERGRLPSRRAPSERSGTYGRAGRTRRGCSRMSDRRTDSTLARTPCCTSRGGGIYVN